MGRDILDEILAIVDARRASAPAAMAAALDAVRERAAGPLRVAIAGKVKAGKSTLLNALVGEQLAPTDASECTRVVTWYSASPVVRVTAVPAAGGDPFSLPFAREAGLTIDVSDHPVETLREIRVEWPSARLEPMSLADTPGIGSLSKDLNERATAFLEPESDTSGRVDAVIYLMRHLHSDDVRLLETFHDGDLGHGTALNSIAVLSRADEIGVARLDAMDSAATIAHRYAALPVVRNLCETVVPIAGLVAEAASALTEADYRALLALCAAGVQAQSSALGSVHEFLGADLPLDGETRSSLLNRLGLFGVRVCVAELAGGAVASAGGLAERLAEVSGLSRLRREIDDRIASRARLLKAKSALTALIDVAVSYDDRQLASDVERIRASAHAFEELRLLAAVRAGLVPLREPELAEISTMMSLLGKAASERLGAPGAPNGELRGLAVRRLEAWQTRAESPLSRATAVDACRVVIRSLEGIVAELDNSV